jgi:hypothetical protein
LCDIRKGPAVANASSNAARARAQFTASRLRQMITECQDASVNLADMRRQIMDSARPKKHPQTPASILANRGGPAVLESELDIDTMIPPSALQEARAAPTDPSKGQDTHVRSVLLYPTFQEWVSGGTATATTVSGPGPADRTSRFFDGRGADRVDALSRARRIAEARQTMSEKQVMVALEDNRIAWELEQKKRRARALGGSSEDTLVRSEPDEESKYVQAPVGAKKRVDTEYLKMPGSLSEG